MDLRDYLRVLRRGWAVVLTFIVLGLAAGIGLTVTTTKIYEATAQIFVATSSVTTDTSALAQANTFASAQVQTYANIASSPAVTKAVTPLINKKFGLTLTEQQVGHMISADAPLNKVLINYRVSNHDPQLASYLANQAAHVFSRYVEGIEQQAVTGGSVVSLHVVRPATVPSKPIKPNKILNIALGFILGLLIGVGVVILRDLLDNTVKGAEDFEAMGIPLLGLVPLDKRTAKQPIAFRADPHSSRSEAYRQLRTNLQFVNVDDNPRIIAVTSAIPGEGKTTTAMNLAAALADAGHRVILIEADLRRPNIARTLGLVPDVGFTTVLIGQTTLEEALQNAGRNLAVLTAGPIPPNPSELLISQQTKAIIRHAAESADYVIIDTAPLLPVADGSEVAALADATVVVHRAGKTTRDQAARSLESLEKVGERPVGVVLNMISKSTGRYEYQYTYGYSYRPDREHTTADASTSEELLELGSSSEPVPPSVDPANDDTARVHAGGPHQPTSTT